MSRASWGPVRIALALGVAMTVAVCSDAATGAARLESSRALVARIAASGRASAAVERRSVDPLSGETVAQRVRLALEPPDRTRLDFAGGEVVTVRGDGGEWLQPGLGQLLKLGPEAAAAARRWWDLLLPAPGTRYQEKRLGDRRYLVMATDADVTDSAWVSLDAAGLPAQLRFPGPDGEMVEVRFSNWQFGKARGRAAFTLEAPPGIQVIDLR